MKELKSALKVAVDFCNNERPSFKPERNDTQTSV